MNHLLFASSQVRRGIKSNMLQNHEGLQQVPLWMN